MNSTEPTGLVCLRVSRAQAPADKPRPRTRADSHHLPRGCHCRRGGRWPREHREPSGSGCGHSPLREITALVGAPDRAHRWTPSIRLKRARRAHEFRSSDMTASGTCPTPCHVLLRRAACSCVPLPRRKEEQSLHEDFREREKRSLNITTDIYLETRPRRLSGSVCYRCRVDQTPPAKPLTSSGEIYYRSNGATRT